MTISYLKDVQPREAEGVTDAQIAGLINLDDTRHVAQKFTVEQIAAKLVAKGKDGPGIVNSVLTAMDAVAADNRIVQNKLDQLDKPGGTVDLGSPLQRKMLRDFAAAGLVAQADVDDLLSLVTVIEPATEAEVTKARSDYRLQQAGQEAKERGNTATNAAVASAESGGDETAQRDALLASWDGSA